MQKAMNKLILKTEREMAKVPKEGEMDAKLQRKDTKRAFTMKKAMNMLIRKTE